VNNTNFSYRAVLNCHLLRGASVVNGLIFRNLCDYRYKSCIDENYIIWTTFLLQTALV